MAASKTRGRGIKSSFHSIQPSTVRRQLRAVIPVRESAILGSSCAEDMLCIQLQVQRAALQGKATIPSSRKCAFAHLILILKVRLELMVQSLRITGHLERIRRCLIVHVDLRDAVGGRSFDHELDLTGSLH